MRIVLLNGPPSCGKDFAAKWLGVEINCGPGGESVVMKFARELKERTHALYRLTDVHGRPMAHDTFEAVKDEPREEFHGRTPRECYIAVSENLIKPLHGKRIFGTWLADSIEETVCVGIDTVLVSDSGFRDEAEVLVDRFGASNCLLVRIHREGYNFDSDSRSYVDLSDLGVQCLDINNSGGPDFIESLTAACM